MVQERSLAMWCQSMLDLESMCDSVFLLIIVTSAMYVISHVWKEFCGQILIL